MSWALNSGYEFGIVPVTRPTLGPQILGNCPGYEMSWVSNFVNMSLKIKKDDLSGQVTRISKAKANSTVYILKTFFKSAWDREVPSGQDFMTHLIL